MQWKESLNYIWNDMDLLPYVFNSLTEEVGKLALTFSRGLPLRELITELDEHFGIIADFGHSKKTVLLHETRHT